MQEKIGEVVYEAFALEATLCRSREQSMHSMQLPEAGVHFQRCTEQCMQDSCHVLDVNCRRPLRPRHSSLHSKKTMPLPLLFLRYRHNVLLRLKIDRAKYLISRQQILLWYESISNKTLYERTTQFPNRGRIR